ncbi:MAG: OPT/YSL family transporter, partial [Planctomycetes bacterium]|nr:OPT/YSL family transporter [Planctomycetota bacterium]
LVGAGMAAALVVELLGIPSLPFAVGLYLPLYLSAPIMVGGLVRWCIDKMRKPTEQDRNNGILGASGLVAGEGLVGIALAGVAALVAWGWDHPKYETPLTAKAEMVVPHHFQPWLADKLGMDLTYGLADRFAEDLPDESLDPTSEPTDPPLTDVPPVKGPPADPQDPGETGSTGNDDAPAQPQDADSDELALEPAEPDAKPQWDLTWFQLLPLAPFAALVVWLFSTALRRTPVPIGALPPVSPAVEPAPATTLPPAPDDTDRDRAAPPPTSPPSDDAGPIPLVEPPEPDAPTVAPSADQEPEPESSIIEFDDQEPPTTADETEPGAAIDDEDVAPDETNDDDDDTGPPRTDPSDRWPPPSPFGT